MGEPTSNDPHLTTPCGLCGTPTMMLATQRCDQCWELEKRMRADPEIAAKIAVDMAIENVEALIAERPEQEEQT